jgi:branched-chain amino acid transport system substrate-binding protein
VASSWAGVGYAVAPKDSGSSDAGGGGTVDKSDIKIGSVSPVTGPYSGDGQEMTRGQELAIDAINAAGGIAGRKLTLVIGDVSDLAPENYVQVAQRLVNQEKVAAVFSGTPRTTLEYSTTPTRACRCST